MDARDRSGYRFHAVLLIAVLGLTLGCRGEQPSPEPLPLDPTDYEVGRPAMSASYSGDAAAYWAVSGLPAVSRLSLIDEELSRDSVLAFAGVAAAFEREGYLVALDSGAFPDDFVSLLERRADLTPGDALFLSVRDVVEELDGLRAGNGDDAGRIGQLRTTLGLVVELALDLDALMALTPPAEKPYEVLPSATIDPLCRAGFDSFSNDVIIADPPAAQPDDSDDATSVSFPSITSVMWTTTYNASCAGQSVGPCAYKLGILPSLSITCKGWNDLSRDLGAVPGKSGTSKSNISKYFQSRGFTCHRAYDGPLESSCEEVKAAQERGCDVLLHYQASDDSSAHMEMVLSTRVDDNDATKCNATTLSWGEVADVDVEKGTSFSSKSDGRRYGSAYLEDGGKATFFYYCP